MEKKVNRNLHLSTTRFLWDWLSLLNFFSGRSLEPVDDVFVPEVSIELSGVSNRFDMVW